MARSGLRGASADALAALSDQLENASAKDAGALGEDLIGAAAVLRAEPGLRRVATDQSTDASAKSGLVRSIFDGKLSAVGLDLVADAVERRWTVPRDLADALEHLGVVAVARSARSDAGRLSDELFTVSEMVTHTPELRAALSDPARTEEDKAELLGGILQGKALPATIRLTQLALNGTHTTVTTALHEYQKVAASVHGESVAKVRVARELSDDEQRRLAEGLTRHYGRAIHLNVTLEPGLIGGMRVEIGDDVIDGSVASRLDDARRRLAG